jgi:beta-glucanase (GH16 family)
MMEKRKLVIFLFVLVTMLFCIISQTFAAQSFYDNFSSGTLDSAKWLIAEKAWGRENGGVIAENVSLKYNEGLDKYTLILKGQGDKYTGDVKGVDRYGNRIEQKTRVGAAIATKDYYASGKYEVRLKLPQNIGACTALWTFHYEEVYKGEPGYEELSNVGGISKSDFTAAGLNVNETEELWNDLASYKNGREPYIIPLADNTAIISDYFRAKVWDISKLDLNNDFGKKENIYILLQNGQGILTQGSEYMGYYKVRNHEVDIELPTATRENPDDISYSNARFNTWIGECGGEYTDPFVEIGEPLNDGQFHTFTFIWHTDNSSFKNKRLEFYIDGVLKQTNYTHIPNIAGRFWIGLWYPTWSGVPDYDIDILEIDWVRITPFNQSGDRYDVPESFPDFGWADYTPAVDNISVDDNDDDINDNNDQTIPEKMDVSYSVNGNELSITATSSYGLKRVNIAGKNGSVFDEWLSSEILAETLELEPGTYSVNITDYNNDVFNENITVGSGTAQNIPENLDVDVKLNNSLLSINAMSGHGLKRVNISGVNGSIFDKWLEGTTFEYQIPLEAGEYYINLTDYAGNIFEKTIKTDVADNPPDIEKGIEWSYLNGILNISINSGFDLKKVQLFSHAGKLLIDKWGNGKEMNFAINEYVPGNEYKLFVSGYNGFAHEYIINIFETQGNIVF